MRYLDIVTILIVVLSTVVDIETCFVALVNQINRAITMLLSET